MCKLRRKLLLFDYIIGKLIEWQAYLKYGGLGGDVAFTNLSAYQINECLTTFSGVRLMKMLYLICLKSVGDEIKNIDETLFGVFDNYIAMPKGPVEDSAYSNRSVLLRYEFYNGVLKLSETYPEHFIFNYPDINKTDFNTDDIHKTHIFNLEMKNPANNGAGEIPLTTYKKLIDQSVAELREMGNLPFENVNKLIDITHKLPLWNRFFNTEDRRFVLVLEDLHEEKNCFQALMN